MANAVALPPQPREIPIGKTILLSIVTLGIYYLIWYYRNSRDINEGNPNGRSAWKALFWLGFVTFGLTWIVLTVFNFLTVTKLRQSIGIQENTMGILALVFYFVLGIVGAILWASHWNDTLRRLRTSAPTPPARAAPRPAAAR